MVHVLIPGGFVIVLGDAVFLFVRSVSMFISQKQVQTIICVTLHAGKILKLANFVVVTILSSFIVCCLIIYIYLLKLLVKIEKKHRD